MPEEKPISQKIWPMKTEVLKHLPIECRREIMEIVKDDVRLCIQEHGIHDPICKDMAEESVDMEEYLLWNPNKKDIDKKCIDNCLGAGISISKHYNEPENRSFWRENIRGLVGEKDLEVPHSELAIHTGAAGGKLLLWTIAKDGRYAHVVYEGREGCCGYAHGSPNEVLSPELREMLRKSFQVKVD